MTLSLPRTVRILMPDGAVRKIELEAYVEGVVAAAMPDGSPAEAAKALAVAARTFGANTHRHLDRGADVCARRHCQLWQAEAGDAVRQTLEKTRGMVAVYGGRLIDAYYFDHCDGRTRDASGVLLSAPPYLRSVDCPCGFASLKGHGIGMCRRGAVVMARYGDSYDLILRHYYHGISISDGVVSDLVLPDANDLSAEEAGLADSRVGNELTAADEVELPPDAGTGEGTDQAPSGVDQEAAAVDSAWRLLDLAPPDSIPEELPVLETIGQEVEPPAELTVESLPVPSSEAAPEPAPELAPPPPPVLEEEIPLTRPSPARVVLDRLPGPLIIEGDLGRPDVIITIRDTAGNAVITVSGTAPHHGVGGFEAPLLDDGLYTIVFDGEEVQADLAGETLAVNLPAPSIGAESPA